MNHAVNLADEAISPSELAAANRIIQLLKGRLAREYPPPKRTLRDAHPKQLGLVRAEFVVAENLPVNLRVGVFRQPKTFPAWVRFSNLSDPPGSDVPKDSRGMAIKLMDVDGDKLFDSNPPGRTHDFVLMSTDFFVTKTIMDFADLVAAIEGGPVKMLLHLLLNPRTAWLLFCALSKCATPFEVSFGSTTPYLLGTQAVKYAVRPATARKTPIPSNPAADYLTQAMVQHLASQPAEFEFLVQLQTDPRRMPIEDPRVVWSDTESPFIKVANLHIPPQTFNSPAQQEFGDNLSFNPWRCLPEHQPLGGINRARRIIYEQMSQFRHERNQGPSEEPSGWQNF